MNPADASFAEIAYGSPDYQETLIHRDRILRRPLGLELSADDVLNEESQRHFILRDEKEILAGLITLPPQETTIKIRQMWVQKNRQGSGLGKHLLDGVAQVLSHEGITTLTLHARETARAFYEKCGYHTHGEPFLEIGIPHIAMIRQLDKTGHPEH